MYFYYYEDYKILYRAYPPYGYVLAVYIKKHGLLN